MASTNTPSAESVVASYPPERRGGDLHRSVRGSSQQVVQESLCLIGTVSPMMVDRGPQVHDDRHPYRFAAAKPL